MTQTTLPLLSKHHVARPTISRRWPWIAIAIVILFVAVIRIRLLHIPLERDEGEYAYMGQLMLQGIPPYLLACNMKLPGIYAAYALIMAIFGQTIAGIHLGLMSANAGAIVLLFLLTRRLFDDLAAVVAAVSYGLLSLSPSVLGTSAHATQFIVPFAVGGTLLLLTALDSAKYRLFLWSGLLYGLAFMLKQHAIFFTIFAVVYMLSRSRKGSIREGMDGNIRRKHPFNFKQRALRAGVLTLASGLPFAASCGVLYFIGVFSKFWFWTFTYARQYVTEISLPCALQLFKIMAPQVVGRWIFLWIIGGIGLTGAFWSKKVRQNSSFLIGFTLFCFFTICPGFYFRNHYFVTLLPAVGLLAGVSVSATVQFLSYRKMPWGVQILPVLVAAAAIMGPTFALRDFLFRATPIQACRMMYGENPFPESLEIATYIDNHSAKDDRIAVIGSEPQIYFYANRQSATGYLYVYGMMEPQAYASRMQFELRRDIEATHPRYVVFVNHPYSWVLRTASDTTIFKWAQLYLGANYRLAGLVDILSDGGYRSYWDEQARRKMPGSQHNVFVLERKEPGSNAGNEDGMETFVNGLSVSLKNWPGDFERLLRDSHLCACGK